ncbi:uncharacterized protein LOC143882797 [Tasmannia lanceolata]|uniref:uncharacterized protein LOC143882797 n=1 Tax=Tasmannia lanceolata TaxID=3420 RepID=UPI004062B746
MEMLSCLLSSFQAQGLISSPFSKGDLTICHTLFADDVMIYAEPNITSAAGIIKCLESFKICSGLEFNPGKSEVFFAGIQNSSKRAICNILKIEEGKLPIKYLGLPLITARLTSRDCQPILDKIKQRISSWSNCHLSRAGRVELVKSVLSTYQIYWSAAFHIPKATLNNIEKILRNFIWAGSNLEKSHHLVSWNTICSPKSEGGLGIRKVSDLNLAAQIKQLWHILTKRNSPWVTWFDRKYIRGRSLWTLPMPASPSWATKSIIKSRDMASKHVCFIVGTQTPLQFWTDPWHPNGPLSAQSSITTSFIPQKASIDEAKFQGGWDLIQVLPHLQELKQIINSGLSQKLLILTRFGSRNLMANSGYVVLGTLLDLLILNLLGYHQSSSPVTLRSSVSQHGKLFRTK